jgi:hypothetical protein
MVKNEVRICGLKHQKEKRSMDHFAGPDVSVKVTSVCGQVHGRIERRSRISRMAREKHRDWGPAVR